MVSTCLYHVLGVSEQAQAEEIRAAFKRHALVAHPDKGGSKDMFHAVYNAFEVLSNSSSRRIYDARRTKSSSSSCSRPAASDDQRTQRRSSGCGNGRETRDSSSRSTSSRQPANKTNNVESNSNNQSHVESNARGATATADHGSSNSNSNSSSNSNSNSSSSNSNRNGSSSSSSSQPSRNVGHSAAEGQQAGGPGSSERAAPRSQGSICAKLYELLKKLSVEARRRVLSESFSEGQRRALELWAKGCRRQEGGNPGADQGAEWQASGQARQEETCDASSSESSSADGPRALGDDGGDSSEDEIVELIAIGDGSLRPEDTDSEIEREVGHQIRDAVFAEDGMPEAHRDSSWTAVKGIQKHTDGSGMRYRSCICIEKIEVATRSVKDLATAVEYLMVLTTIRQAASENTKSGLDDRLTYALAHALREHHKTAEEMGLRWQLRFRQSFWAGRRAFRTPTLGSLSAVIDAWRRLSPFFVQNTGARGRGHVLWHCGLSELQEQWCVFKTVFSEVCEKTGARRETVLSTLDRVAQSNCKHREKLLELWERDHMKLEDKYYRGRRHTSDRQHTRGSEAWQQERLMLQIGLGLRRFQRLEAQKTQQMAREAARSAAAKRTTLREAERERRVRWKQMNRSDVTMADLLGARFGAGACSHST
ncbi:unnamed protein product [Polarella glacialis]|uniref:J domain-containing protein n=1 Tax=Polarella glacialis TaxID=89957 RepID=A0A813LC43_POLGL|nr:unnamed protein product [Polarella glacialis]CAE8726305.1 unnamed protein product [Polarella glacialis]